ncbi:unnamed protein product [Fraxinus pennsylvanica]|uniref:Uncharacterized protein n=1 Tax=Fraxinus pennsylvanica TaxID=56036 RepID=A0AAD2EF23_9LAMI|nr:unnamed protein product [Fraxinus pennsylvanica]
MKIDLQSCCKGRLIGKSCRLQIWSYLGHGKAHSKARIKSKMRDWLLFLIGCTNELEDMIKQFQRLQKLCRSPEPGWEGCGWEGCSSQWVHPFLMFNWWERIHAFS